MAHRGPTQEEKDRADEWIKCDGEAGASLDQRVELLTHILNSDFDQEYKEAAKDLLRYYAALLLRHRWHRSLSAAKTDTLATIRRIATEYRRLPIERRRDIEGHISPSTIGRYMKGKTKKLNPLTEIKLAITLGLPCLEP